MKMSMEHFERLKSAIQKVCDMGRSPKEYQQSSPGYSDKRVRWDFSYAAKRFDPEIFSDIYAAGLNDTHIDTALRQIIKL